MRDAIEEHIGTEVNIADNDNISIFSLHLNLESVSMTSCMTMRPGSYGIPKSGVFENIHIDCKMRAGDLLFKNPSHVSTEAVIRLLLASNAHVMLLGGRGCGKTRLIADLLSELEKSCATPLQIREGIENNLMEIVTGADYSHGM